MGNLLLTRLDEFSQAPLLIKHMNRAMPLSKEMVELLVLQIIHMFYNIGWVQGHRCLNL